MSEGAIFLNSGPLFNAERLESLEETEAWTELGDEVEAAYAMIRESFEKHATLLAGNPSVDETRYFIGTPTLHALGFMASVDERVDAVSEGAVHVDYALFANADDFVEAEPYRGTGGFFRTAVGIVECIAWGTDLDAAADEEEGSASPAQKLDVLLRATGCDYGVLTNGCDWRIYHRATSNLQDTYFQADMIAAVKGDYEDFKRFYMLFRASAFLKGDSGESFLDRLLQ
jgi:hypothetical protein